MNIRNEFWIQKNFAQVKFEFLTKVNLITLWKPGDGSNININE